MNGQRISVTSRPAAIRMPMERPHALEYSQAPRHDPLTNSPASGTMDSIASR